MEIKQFTEQYNESTNIFILSILEGEFGHTNIPRPDLDDISGFYQIDKGNFWLAIHDNKIIGTIGLKDYRGLAYIKRMIVDREFRGKGVAQDLLEVVINHCKDNGFSKIYLSTSKNLVAANKFYEKEGFEIVDALPKEIPSQIAQINYMKLI